MFWKWFRRKVNSPMALFNGHFVEVKAFYALQFDAVPCVTFIGDIDVSKAYALISEQLNADLVSVYQHTYFDHEEQQMFFNNSIFVLRGQRMIELGNNYCQLLHTTSQYAWANKLVKDLAVFRKVNKEPAIGFTRQTSMN